jgi:hypothetical protein
VEKLILKSLLLLSFMLLASCGKKQEDTVGIAPYTVISGNLSQNDTGGIGGSGDAVLRFNSTLSGVTSNQAIEIKGSLLPAGSVSVIFNSEDLALADNKGVIFTLTRATEPGSTTCAANVSVKGVAVAVATQRLAYINCFDFDVFVEVHNTATTARLFVWRKDLLSYSIVNADVDSSVSADLQSSFPGGGGQGIFAGLKLHNVTLTGAQVGDAKVTIP